VQNALQEEQRGDLHADTDSAHEVEFAPSH